MLRQLILTETRPNAPAVGGLTGDLARLPPDYDAVLRIANGFTTHRPRFILFSKEEVAMRRHAPWAAAYGRLFERFITIGEDIFGDQYGYLTVGPPILSKFACEGGAIEACAPGDLQSYIREQILSPTPAAFDSDLAQQAWQAGMMPTEAEHLAFRVPLIVGGEYALANLAVESTELHLGLLGQLSATLRSLPEGHRITGFEDLT